MLISKKGWLAAGLLIAFLGLNIGKALAQTTVQATGTVLEPIQMSGTNLNFGNNIFPGIDKQVAHTEASAAQFDITGEAGAEVVATLTLPTELSDGGSNTLPITFSTQDAGHATASTDQSVATSFDPGSPLTTLLDASTGSLYLWLGGTVTPAKTQPAGTYAADITLDVVYTGN